MKRILVILALVLTSTSCSLYQNWLVNNKDDLCETLNCSPIMKVSSHVNMDSSISYQTQTHVHDDSLNWLMFLECDSNNNVLLNRVMNLDADKDSIETELKDNVLRISKFWKDSIQYLNKELEIKETRIDTIFVEEKVRVPVKEKYIPWWLWFLWGLSVAFILFVRWKI